jgi:hypothetical protein
MAATTASFAVATTADQARYRRHPTTFFSIASIIFDDDEIKTVLRVNMA